MWHRWLGCGFTLSASCVWLCPARRGSVGYQRLVLAYHILSYIIMYYPALSYIIIYHLQCGRCSLRGRVCSHGLWCVQAARAASSLVPLQGSCQGKSCRCCLSCRTCSPQAQPCSWAARWNCGFPEAEQPSLGGRRCSAPVPESCSDLLEQRTPGLALLEHWENHNQVQIQAFGRKGLHFSVE